MDPVSHPQFEIIQSDRTLDVETEVMIHGVGPIILKTKITYDGVSSSQNIGDFAEITLVGPRVVDSEMVGIGNWRHFQKVGSLVPGMTSAVLDHAANMAYVALNGEDAPLWFHLPDHRKHKYRIISAASINAALRALVVDRDAMNRFRRVVMATRQWAGLNFIRDSTREDDVVAALEQLTMKDYEFLSRINGRELST